MIDFFIHFLVCNLLIRGMIGILFCIKNLLKSHLTSRTQYNLWFLPLCLMVVPFLPIQFDHVFSMFSWFTDFSQKADRINNTVNTANTFHSPDTVSDWMNDFAISVSS